MLTLDGSMGEGGGQIVRTSLSLSLVTGRPFRLVNIRAGRRNPGLGNQHLAALRACRDVGRARVEGDEKGSLEVTFEPREVRPGEYRIPQPGAGSTTLVLQTLLSPLLTADAPSRLLLEGGTHNPFAPPFDFLDRAYLPLLRRMGPEVRAELERPGFYPAGGGRLRVRVAPAAEPGGLRLLRRGPIRECRARAWLSDLPRHIGDREVATAAGFLDIPHHLREVVEVEDPAGPGNAIVVEVESDEVTEVFTGFGERGVPAEDVAGRAARAARDYVEAGVPVGPHLADQLLVPMAVGGGGAFRTVRPTSHTRTNAEVVRRFLDVEIVMEREPDGEPAGEAGDGAGEATGGGRRGDGGSPDGVFAETWRVEVRPGRGG